MGGASRGERRRRQAAAADLTPSTPAAGAPPEPPLRNRRVPVAIGVVLVLAAVFGITYAALSAQSGTPEPAAAYPVAVNGVVVTAGQPTAPVTVAVYEDFLCPDCKRLENRSGGDLAIALNEGRIKVDYHGVAVLDDATDPPGYSTRAANAALCAVPAGIWPAYHDRLFTDQPGVGGPGLTAAQLTAIGTELGAGPGFGACVEANANAAAITAATAAAEADPALQTDGRFGTPTVAVAGRKIDVSGDWVARVLAGP